MEYALAQVLGRIIKDLRKARGYSQESFADACGVHRNFMGVIERGETNLSLQNLSKVAGTLGLTMSQMLDGLEARANHESAEPKQARQSPGKPAKTGGYLTQEDISKLPTVADILSMKSKPPVKINITVIEEKPAKAAPELPRRQRQE